MTCCWNVIGKLVRGSCSFSLGGVLSVRKFNAPHCPAHDAYSVEYLRICETPPVVSLASSQRVLQRDQSIP